MATLKRDTMLLTGSGLVEFALQFLIPIIFVRSLDAATFGEYRLLWLVAGTALALAPTFMPQSLFYFLPRATEEQQGTLIGNVVAYLSIAGIAVALILTPWNPLLPDNISQLYVTTKGISSAFLGSWIVVSLMTILPVAEGRVSWQVRNDVTLAVLRTILLATAAVLTAELIWIIAALMAEALLRILTMVHYLMTRTHPKISVRAKLLQTQLKYAIPFAISSSLYQLRGVADQWIIASMLSASLFGIFSISAVFLSLVGLIKQPVINATTPHLNRAFALGQTQEFICLFRKSSGALTIILTMISGGLFCVLPGLVHIIYTDRYAEAVPVMRTYLIIMMLQGFATGYLIPVINRAGSAVLNNACCLVLSCVFSYVGTLVWGLPGAALGSVAAFILSECWSLNIVARTLGVKMLALLPWKPLVCSGSASVAALIIVELASGLPSASPIVQLAVKSFLYTAVFSSVFVVIADSGQLKALNIFSGIFLAKKAILSK